MSKILLKMYLVAAMVTPIILPLSNIASAQLLPFTQYDLDRVNRSQNFRDPGLFSAPCSPGSGQGGLAAGSSFFILGDSLTVGMINEGSLEQKMETAGWSVTGVAAAGGENLSWGLEQVKANEQQIASSSAILIGLGTNNVGDVVPSDGSSSPIPQSNAKVSSKIQEIVDEINRINTNTRIYWTNIYIEGVLSNDFGTFNMDVARDQLNIAIESVATEEPKMEVVPWGYGITAQSLLSDDGIHPYGKYPEMADFIVEQIAQTGGSTSNPAVSGVVSGTPSGPITLETPGSTYTLDLGWQPIIAAAAARFEIDPYILAGILRVETGWPDSASVEAERIRNSATATGPFQILDIALQDISDVRDEDYPQSRSDPVGRVIRRVGGTNSAFEPDGSRILDADKDGAVSRHNPEDAAYLAAAYVKYLGGNPGIPLGNPYDPIGTAGQEIEAGTNTVAKIMFHYNQGENWTSQQEDQGNNDTEHYMTAGIAAYEAVRAAGWFGAGVSGPNGCNTQTTTGDFVWPVASGGRVTACWADLRNKTVSGGSYYHSGVDIAANEGEDVVSVAPGEVVFAGTHSAYGNLVIVKHSDNLYSNYGHMVSISTEEGATVAAGQILGGVGNTGVSLGNHLHLNFYDTWPFGELPQGAANTNGNETLNPLTQGLKIPTTVPDEPGCVNYPDGGREVDIAL